MEKLGDKARQLIDECVSSAMKETYKEITSDEPDHRITKLAREMILVFAAGEKRKKEFFLRYSLEYRSKA